MVCRLAARCEFCPVTWWKMAMHGLCEIQQCPRRNTNSFFMHAEIPTINLGKLIGTYLHIDMALPPRRAQRGESLGSHHQHHARPRRKPCLVFSCKRKGEAGRKMGRHGGRKSHRHIAKSRERHGSQSRERKMDLGQWEQELEQEPEPL